MSESLLFSAENYISALDYEEMSSPQRMFSLVWALESEVNNGGFWQFFYNLSGEYAPETPDALIQIGADGCSDTVIAAISLIPLTATDWRNEAQRRMILDTLGEGIKERLSKLDTQFYGYPDNLSALLTAFVKANRHDFGI